MIRVGFRFVPSDIDLICYLWERVYGEGPQGIMKNIIVERDLYGSESPTEIFNGTTATELYFFTVLKKKFSHGVRMDRTVRGKGTWTAQYNGKSEGGCKIPAIYDPNDKSVEIGYRKNLSFTPKGEKARFTVNGKKESWVMHEYTLKEYPPGKDVFALCRISKGRSDKRASSSSCASVSSEGLEENDEYQAREKRPRTTTTLASVPHMPMASLDSVKSYLADGSLGSTSGVVAVPLDGGLMQQAGDENFASQEAPEPSDMLDNAYDPSIFCEDLDWNSMHLSELPALEQDPQPVNMLMDFSELLFEEDPQPVNMLGGNSNVDSTLLHSILMPNFS
ncbi:hypothetical protein IFM89_006974 [Coptis chinensis]|uniref:NAC domain-containing protein n=1 Tax=Coptis chinensis TaxID=261450 RepID=A0A835LKP8_9MAGN|nr:hypothetical protein IFM89_006974 [Coptis chinensis]